MKRFLCLVLAWTTICLGAELFNGKCPTCVKEGKKSTLTVQLFNDITLTSYIYDTRPDYDEDGNFIVKPPPPRPATHYKCSNGHYFSVQDGKIVGEKKDSETQSPAELPKPGTPQFLEAVRNMAATNGCMFMLATTSLPACRLAAPSETAQYLECQGLKIKGRSVDGFSLKFFCAGIFFYTLICSVSLIFAVRYVSRRKS